MALGQVHKDRWCIILSNTLQTTSVSNTISKSFSIPDDEFLDDTLSVARKFLNEGTTKGTSANTKFANQSTSGTKLYFVTPLPKTKVLPKVVEMNDLSNPVTSNLAPTLNDSQVLKNDKVIAPGMFRINLVKSFREYKFMPINQARAKRVDKTAKTRRPKPRSNTKNDMVPSVSKSHCIKTNEVEVE
ncbi:hypothetical protein Tco_0952266 [Tanacetum coccineum]|uniref:Uncharacterized protein n=1 Tax=Tanacetum coccineum TaxID=301880 RepID=A0ABQ5DWH7_9ASTR